MDVVLETFDALLFDRLYASFLPIYSSATAFDPLSTITATLKGQNLYNATWQHELWQAASTDIVKSAWQFQPASETFSLQPSEYAYLSRWDRDNFYRQCLSLYVITA